MKICYKDPVACLPSSSFAFLQKNLWLDLGDKFMFEQMPDAVFSDDDYCVDLDRFEGNTISEQTIYLINLPFPGHRYCVQFGNLLLVSVLEIRKKQKGLIDLLYIINLFRNQDKSTEQFYLDELFNLNSIVKPEHIKTCSDLEFVRLYLLSLVRITQISPLDLCTVNMRDVAKDYFQRIDCLELKKMVIEVWLDISLPEAAGDRDWLNEGVKGAYSNIELNKTAYKTSKPGAYPCFPIILPLRRHNSWTPFQPGSDADKTGGGYFISNGKTSLLIDPGISVVDSLYKDHGISISDIDAIVVTHDHPDHHAELLRIFSLWYAYYGKTGKKLKILLNISSYNLYYQMCIYYSKILEGGSAIILEGNDRLAIGDMILQTLPMPHEEIFDTIDAANRDKLNIFPDKKSCSLGLRLTLFSSGSEVWDIALPGDTAFPGNVVDLRKIIDFYKNCHIVCLHIGSLEKDWLTPGVSPSSVSYGERKHLGLVGVIKMIGLLNSELAIVTEFGYELESAQIKLALIEIVKRLILSKETLVIPSDSKLYLAIIDNDMCFKCKCGNFVDIKSICCAQGPDQSIVYHFEQGCSSGLDHI